VPASDDRWDVVVVGLRDPSHAAAMMAVAELAHYASLPPQDVERMLEEGEVPVLENLDRAEAERAAMELAELGVVVDLRVALSDSGVFPVFKPDAERQIGVAVGGLIDDSATPPTVGATMGVPELEPDLEAPQQPRGRPSSSGSREGRRSPPPGANVGPPMKAPDKRAPEPSRGDSGLFGLDLLEDEPPPPPPPAPRPSQPAASASGSGARAGGPAASASGSGARAGGDARARANTPSPARDAGGGRSPASKAAGIESLLSDIGASGPSAEPKLPERLQRATAAAASGQGEIELDFAAAGIAPAPKRGLIIGLQTPVAEHGAERSASDMPRRSRAGNIGGTGASAAGRASGEDGLLDALRSDGVAMVLLGLGVGLALGLVLALQMQRGDARELLPPLEEELAASLNDPAGVAAGKDRAPSVIEGEIDVALDELQRSFLMWWLAPGLIVGLLLSRLRAS
jgi:hypothetical protein